MDSQSDATIDTPYRVNFETLVGEALFAVP